MAEPSDSKDNFLFISTCSMLTIHCDDQHYLVFTNVIWCESERIWFYSSLKSIIYFERFVSIHTHWVLIKWCVVKSRQFTWIVDLFFRPNIKQSIWCFTLYLISINCQSLLRILWWALKLMRLKIQHWYIHIHKSIR